MVTSRSFVIVALAALAAVAPRWSAAADRDEAVKKELAALVGQWDYQGHGASGDGRERAVALFHGGRNADEVGFKWELYVLEVKGDKFSFAATDAGKTTVSIDPSRTPKTIDLTDAKGRTWLGAYELKGDQLIIAVGFGKTRPKKVSDDAVPGEAYVIYKRPKK